MIDVNADKKPNVVGKDIFQFILTDTQILPSGYSLTNEEIEDNCKVDCQKSWWVTTCGQYCATKASKKGYNLPVVND